MCLHYTTQKDQDLQNGIRMEWSMIEVYIKDSKSTKTRAWDGCKDPKMHKKMPKREGHDMIMPTTIVP